MFITLAHFFAFMLNAINVLYVIVYAGFWWFVVYVMYGAIDCMLRVFDPGRLHVVRVGNLNELTTS